VHAAVLHRRPIRSLATAPFSHSRVQYGGRRHIPTRPNLKRSDIFFSFNWIFSPPKLYRVTTVNYLLPFPCYASNFQLLTHWKRERKKTIVVDLTERLDHSWNILDASLWLRFFQLPNCHHQPLIWTECDRMLLAIPLNTISVIFSWLHNRHLYCQLLTLQLAFLIVTQKRQPLVDLNFVIICYHSPPHIDEWCFDRVWLDSLSIHIWWFTPTFRTVEIESVDTNESLNQRSDKRISASFLAITCHHWYLIIADESKSITHSPAIRFQGLGISFYLIKWNRAETWRIEYIQSVRVWDQLSIGNTTSKYSIISTRFAKSVQQCGGKKWRWWMWKTQAAIGIALIWSGWSDHLCDQLLRIES